MPDAGDCDFFHFGLIVTGRGEREHLPKLLRSLLQTGICSVSVIDFVPQLSPITSETRRLTLVGTRKQLPTRDQELGLYARACLMINACHYVILIDDLEHDRRDQAQAVFDRYRQAFDSVLTPDQQRRAAVHFLVNMLEAYYFADAAAVNAVLVFDPPLEDYDGDVEDIRHPKGELKQRFAGYDEVEHGGQILAQLDVEHVLSDPTTCASLRTLFAWCVKVIMQYPHELPPMPDYRLADGALYPITQPQLDLLN